MSIKIGILDNYKSLNFPDIAILDENIICDGKKTDLDLILINLDEFLNKGINFTGLVALYHLRLNKEVSCPIICYGFQPLSKLLKSNPKFFILYAPKNSYLQLPFNLTNIRLEYEKLKLEYKDKDIFELYPKYVTSAQNEAKLIHEDANIYALNKTARSWYSFMGIKGNKRPMWFRDKFKNYGRYDIALIVSEFLFEKTHSEDDDSASLENELNEIKSNINKLKNKKIIYIDDMGSLGWTDLFKNIFEEISLSDIFEEIKLSDVNSFVTIDKIFDNIKTNIDFSNSANTIIFLDLRLFNERGHREIEELSGYKLLKKIKVFNPAIPVIIVSATNNKNNINYLLRSGAFFVWNKEGVQNRLSLYGYRASIYKLLQNTYDAFCLYQNEANRFISRFDFYLKRFQSCNNYSQLIGKLTQDQQTATELVVDTNAFLDEKYLIPLNTYLLIELFIKQGKTVVLMHDVYFELLRFSLWDNVSISAQKEYTRRKQRMNNSSTVQGPSPKEIWCAKYAIEYINLNVTQKKIRVKSKKWKSENIDLSNDFGDFEIVIYKDNIASNPYPVINDGPTGMNISVRSKKHRNNSDFENGLDPYSRSSYADKPIEQYYNNSTTILVTKDKKLIEKINTDKKYQDRFINFDTAIIWDEPFIKTYFENITW